MISMPSQHLHSTSPLPTSPTRNSKFTVSSSSLLPLPLPSVPFGFSLWESMLQFDDSQLNLSGGVDEETNGPSTPSPPSTPLPTTSASGPQSSKSGEQPTSSLPSAMAGQESATSQILATRIVPAAIATMGAFQSTATGSPEIPDSGTLELERNNTTSNMDFRELNFEEDEYDFDPEDLFALAAATFASPRCVAATSSKMIFRLSAASQSDADPDSNRTRPYCDSPSPSPTGMSSFSPLPQPHSPIPRLHPHSRTHLPEQSLPSSPVRSSFTPTISSSSSTPSAGGPAPSTALRMRPTHARSVSASSTTSTSADSNTTTTTSAGSSGSTASTLTLKKKHGDSDGLKLPKKGILKRRGGDIQPNFGPSPKSSVELKPKMSTSPKQQKRQDRAGKPFDSNDLLFDAFQLELDWTPPSELDKLVDDEGSGGLWKSWAGSGSDAPSSFPFGFENESRGTKESPIQQNAKSGWSDNSTLSTVECRDGVNKSALLAPPSSTHLQVALKSAFSTSTLAVGGDGDFASMMGGTSELDLLRAITEEKMHWQFAKNDEESQLKSKPEVKPDTAVKTAPRPTRPHKPPHLEINTTQRRSSKTLLSDSSIYFSPLPVIEETRRSHSRSNHRRQSSEFDWSSLDDLDDELVREPFSSFGKLCWSNAVSDEPASGVDEGDEAELSRWSSATSFLDGKSDDEKEEFLEPGRRGDRSLRLDDFTFDLCEEIERQMDMDTEEDAGDVPISVTRVDGYQQKNILDDLSAYHSSSGSSTSSDSLSLEYAPTTESDTASSSSHRKMMVSVTVEKSASFLPSFVKAPSSPTSPMLSPLSFYTPSRTHFSPPVTHTPFGQPPSKPTHSIALTPAPANPTMSGAKSPTTPRTNAVPFPLAFPTQDPAKQAIHFFPKSPLRCSHPRLLLGRSISGQLRGEDSGRRRTKVSAPSENARRSISPARVTESGSPKPMSPRLKRLAELWRK